MNKFVVGLTGEIGCGKSHITNLFTSLGKKCEIPVVDVDMDVIAHELLEYNFHLRQSVFAVFNTVERKELSKFVFGNKNNRKLLDDIFYPHILQEIKQEIDESEGIVLVNGALLIESGFFEQICDYKTMLVLTPADIQLNNLLRRGYTLENSLQRVECQLSSILKYAKATELVKKSDVGFVDCIYNYRGDEDEQVSGLLRRYHEKLKPNLYC